MDKERLKMLIAISLGILIILTLFSVIAGANWISLGLDSTFSDTPEGYIGSGSFSIDPLTGAIGIILIVIMICVIFGMRFFSSGLSEQSVRTITIGLSYVSIWILFSIFAEPLLVQIEVFGLFLYIILTIMFTIGILQKITLSV